MNVCATRFAAIASAPAFDASAGIEEKLRVAPLDLHIRTQADARKNIAAPFVLLLPDGSIAGYYTLSSTSVRLGELPAQTAR
jgi:hypothetical protein